MPWDKGAPSPPLEDWLEKSKDEMEGEILVPGCGLGHDVRLLAGRTKASVVGLDLSSRAIEQAQSVEKSGSEVYVVDDLFALPKDWSGRFDWVWEHTCFCAIDPELRDGYVTAMHEVLTSEGQLLGVFYLDPYDEDHRPGERPPHGCTEEELRTRFVESGKFEWVESGIPEKTYPGREGRELLVHLRRVS